MKIVSYSTALYSTWIYIDKYKLLFDAGDGLSLGLHKHLGKVRNVFISHADRDHLCGLLQFNQLNNINNVYYPVDCGSFIALNNFIKKFDFYIRTPNWIGIDSLSVIDIGSNAIVKAHLNDHRYEINKTKSVGYKIIERKNKLKEQYIGLSGKEIKELKEKKVDVTDIIEEEIIGYSGDTKSFVPELWENVGWLIHESTFLNYEESDRQNHTNLEEFLCKSKDLNLKGLILSHFSVRYKDDEIINKIRKIIKNENIKFPIYVILPGKINYNVLNENNIIY